MTVTQATVTQATRPTATAFDRTTALRMLPPSPFRRLASPVGGVSIDYTVHIHRTLPADRDLWLEGVFATSVSQAGIALEHGTIATPDGMPVAETFHTRWTGVR